MSRGKYNALEKLAILEEVSNGKIGFLAAAKKYGINKTTLMKWQRRYKTYGYEGLERRTHLQSYSAELKLQAVKDYLVGGLSQYQIIDKYKIASTSQLFNWIKKYNGHSSLKAYKGEARAMTKGRSTTWQERIEIVQYCLTNQHDYQKTAGQFQVSYQQIYQWMKKFEVGGQDALKDGRGRKKARSSYYKWLNRKSSARELENEQLTRVMMTIYEKVERTFGYRRLTLHMRKQTGKTINHKRVERLMKVMGIQSVIRKKKRKYANATPQQVAENLLNRKFHADAPNEKWLTDVTEFKYGDGQKAYLSAILDLHDKTIVSYVLGRSNNNPLVFQTLKLALQSAPGSSPMLHSDRGYQYTSLGFKKLLDDNNMIQSMSRVGRCIDNGPMESFWGTLKCEKYYLHTYHTFEELKKDIEAYIHFYNNERLQAKLNGLSPMEFRTKAA